MPLDALGGYVLSVCLLAVGGAQPWGTALRAPLMLVGVVVFLAGAVAHILDKQDRMNDALAEKIDHSVGDVWDAGERAGVRHAALEVPALSVVPDVVPRR